MVLRTTSPVCGYCHRMMADGTEEDLVAHVQREHGQELLARLLRRGPDLVRDAVCDRCGDHFHCTGPDEVKALAEVEAEHTIECGGALTVVRKDRS